MFHPFANVRPDERGPVWGALITLWGIMAGHSLLETARDALFLDSLPAQRLPWVYLLIAVVAVAMLQFQRRLTRNRSNRHVLTVVLLGSAAITAGLWALLARPHPWLIGAVYVWAGIFATLVVLRFWMLIDDVFTITQAKRVFAVIGAGSVVGAITGSALARGLSEFLEPRHFLLVAAGIIALSGLLPTLALEPGKATVRSSADVVKGCTDPFRWSQCLAVMRGRTYVRRLMALGVLSMTTLTFADYLFKSVVAENIPGYALSEFFATTYLGLNLVSLALQITVVSVMLRRMELRHVLGLTPTLLAVGAVVVLLSQLLWPTLVLFAAIGLKGIDGSLRHSLHRTSVETLFVPLTHEMREQVKAFVDVLGQRGGQALASLTILVLVLLPGATVWVATALILSAGVWVWLAADLQRHYLDLFRDTLAGTRLGANLDFPDLDVASLETLIGKLNSDDDAEVLAAIDLLAEQGKVHLIPALALYHPSTPVVIRILELFTKAGRRDVVSLLERLSEHEDENVRAAVLRTRAVIAPDVNRQLSEFLDDPSAVVRATALVTLVSAQWIEGPDAEKALRAMAQGAEIEELEGLVLSVQQHPHPIHTTLLLDLSGHPDLALRREVAIAMRAVGSAEFIPILVRMLPFRLVRGEARRSLLSFGDAALDALAAVLADETQPQNIRRHIPRTLHRFDSQRAAEILLAQLRSVGDGMVRFKILRALGALRTRNPHVELDPRSLREALDLTVEGMLRVLDWRARLGREGRENPAVRTDVFALLDHALRMKETHARERAFRLLSLLHPEENWQSIHRGLESDLPENRASAHELIEAALAPPLRDTLLAFVDDLPVARKLASGRAFYTARTRSYDDLLDEFLERGSLVLRSLAIYHIGELGLVQLRAKLEGLHEVEATMQTEVVARSLARLDAAGNTRGDR